MHGPVPNRARTSQGVNSEGQPPAGVTAAGRSGPSHGPTGQSEGRGRSPDRPSAFHVLRAARGKESGPY